MAFVYHSVSRRLESNFAMLRSHLPFEPIPRALAFAFVAFMFAAFVTQKLCLGDESKTKTPGTQPVDFERDIQPIFRDHCLSCHGETTQESDYRLDVREIAMRGGSLGEAPIVAGNSEASPLVHLIDGSDESMLMPPASSNKPRLSRQQVATIKAWIDQNATWPDSANATIIDKSDWWSLHPMSRPTVPMSESANPIDAFVEAEYAKRGLTGTEMADRRTLVRRLYFDLIGLPPTLNDVERFVADQSPQAWARLVDSLLASPRYGERWARHWLDVVHFGETHGYDKDKLRENAWPYRDYVIRAFNEDKPYARFVQEQIAGDVLYPDTRDGVEARGFIAAGPWDFIGHAEVSESKIDGKIARHIDRDDMVQNTMLTFNSMTVGCAQCHDHKFDAISQEDYYRLQAVFAAVDRTDVEYHEDSHVNDQFNELKAANNETDSSLAAIESSLEKQAGASLAELDQLISLAGKTDANTKPEFGYHTEIANAHDVIKWVQVDLGKRVNIDRVVLQPCYDDFNGIGAGFGFPVRFKVEASDDEAFATGVTLLRDRHDETYENDVANPGLTPFTITAGPELPPTRYVRVTATKLAPRKDDYILALSELQVFDAGGNNVTLNCDVDSLDSIEASPRWSRQNLTDGIAPQGASKRTRQELVVQRDELLLSFADTALRAKLLALRENSKTLNRLMSDLPPPRRVYAGAVHTGTGNFRGTGNEGGRPRAIHVLHRGDVNQPQTEVQPGALSAISCLPAQFELSPDHSEGDRRAALARWLTDPTHPLTWRSIVNRVWQYHFGRGIVETSNDFGRNGSLPSHPALLDWLATEFRDNGGSLKDLHRLIVTSKTYQQASTVRTDFEAIDANNVFLWRMNRTKLDAECIRDSVLAVSGRLNLKMGGESFRDFVIESPQHSPHYEYALHDPNDTQSHRRSIYRCIVRSQLQPFMSALDCADPSMQVERRNESLSPIQALALLNNGLMVTSAARFAEKLDASGNDLATQVEFAFRGALAREPSRSEREMYTQYAEQFGLANMCRVIFNLNEFAFVD